MQRRRRRRKNVMLVDPDEFSSSVVRMSGNDSRLPKSSSFPEL